MIDLLDGDLYAGDPYPTYAWMREHAPVYWDAGNELWGIARYDDIVEIEKAKDVFISSDKNRVVRAGEASAAQAAGGHSEIASVLLHHDVGRHLGRAEKGVFALVDRKILGDAVLKGGSA